MVSDGKDMNIAFRCDGSPDIGSGHVMRCLTLAQAFKKKNYDIVFFSSKETLKTIAPLKDSKFPVAQDDQIHHTDWLIVDHYGLDSSYEKNARSWAKKIMVIDDLANRTHDCDVLLDQTYGREPSDYEGLVPENCKVLTGSSYALLREEFSELRKKMNRDFSNAEHILVSFGGVNPKKSTEYALSMLRTYKEKPLNIDVVTSSGANGLSLIRDAVDQIQNEGFHTASLHIDTIDMATLMMQADLCIGAGGTTSWERCCLKLPTITIELADNQKFILNNLNKTGAIHNLGPIEDLDPNFLRSEFDRIINDIDTLRLLSQQAGLACDGSGADKVTREILCA